MERGAISDYDLVIRGGTVITAADIIAWDVGIKDGVMTTLGNKLGSGTCLMALERQLRCRKCGVRGKPSSEARALPEGCEAIRSHVEEVRARLYPTIQVDRFERRRRRIADQLAELKFARRGFWTSCGELLTRMSCTGRTLRRTFMLIGNVLERGSLKRSIS